MHVELLIPGLLPVGERLADALNRASLPALERLLAKGRRTRDESASPERWLAEGFGLEEDFPAGALSFASRSGEDNGEFRMRADPVHLRLGRDRMVLMPAAAFSISADEAAALDETLNAHFGEAMQFQAVEPDAWCVRMAPNSAAASSPVELAGANVNDNLPTGAEAMRFHALMNEVQMLLHEHPVNEAREARGEPAVNSLWFWGGGVLREKPAGSWRTVTSSDPSLRGLARLAGVQIREPQANAGTWLAASPPEGRQLVHIDVLRFPAALGDSDAWSSAVAQLEAGWFAPLAEALARGDIGMLTIQVPDAREALRVEVARGDLRRFWRRAKPLSRYA